ncbi:hypothetical protein [Methylophaga sulfidovorans]|uniref:hypothetical protein n=1 Tax=Methylophaga sulfidovorans TaxID=45496 RepID=UPI000B8082CD|nr:hypothetical protein [Methylophaga sulfidovorans]
MGIIAATLIFWGYLFEGNAKIWDLNFVIYAGTILTIVLALIVDVNDEKFDGDEHPEIDSTGHRVPAASKLHDRED